MTIDKSLRVRSGMIRNRNVLTRAERIEKLKNADRWQDGDGVLGLPKEPRADEGSWRDTQRLS